MYCREAEHYSRIMWQNKLLTHGSQKQEKRLASYKRSLRVWPSDLRPKLGPVLKISISPNGTNYWGLTHEPQEDTYPTHSTPNASFISTTGHHYIHITTSASVPHHGLWFHYWPFCSPGFFSLPFTFSPNWANFSAHLWALLFCPSFLICPLISSHLYFIVQRKYHFS